MPYNGQGVSDGQPDDSGLSSSFGTGVAMLQLNLDLSISALNYQRSIRNGDFTVEEFISKPFNPLKLNHTIGKVLN